MQDNLSRITMESNSLTYYGRVWKTIRC